MNYNHNTSQNNKQIEDSEEGACEDAKEAAMQKEM